MSIQVEAVYENGVFRPLQPVDLPEHQRVTVTVVPAAVAAPHRMTQEEWRQFILSTAGSITDPTFQRHDQGSYEQREQLP
ncbi:MAG TPA: antitoxin family protein [Gemmataceae bacterium]|nr:antitoxin family protein [Gemmataceae bacterium]